MFESFTIENGLLRDMGDNPHPTRLYGWRAGGGVLLEGDSSFYGFVCEGPTEVRTAHNSYMLRAGQYFCFSGKVEISGGLGIAVEAVGYRGLEQLGGPVEEMGRLRYIDGCTDTLLLSPARMGDPCLNALFFPPMTDQTRHSHPSIRVGLILKGRGECVADREVIPLKPGMAFIIHQDALHKFRTGVAEGMTVIAYHPDSDCGPRDEDHPMINRTIIADRAASR